MNNIAYKKSDICDFVEKFAKSHLGNNFVFRENQLEIITNIVWDKLNNIPNHIVQAPTGSGKSLIIIIAAGVLAEYFNKTSYILVSDLFLYKQYEDFIDDNNLYPLFAYVKGQTGNYICPKDNCDVRQASCKLVGDSFARLKENKWCMKNCTYLQERFAAVEAKVTLMTYQNFHFHMNICYTKFDSHNLPIQGAFQYRDCIFCDECHNIPSIVQNKCRPTVSKDDIKMFTNIYNYYKGICSPNNYVIKKFPNTAAVKKEFDTYMKKFSDMKCDSYTDTINLLNFTHKLVDIIYIAAERCQAKLRQKYKKGLTLTQNEKSLWGQITYIQNYHCYLDDFCRSIELSGFHYTVKQKTDNGFTFSCVKEDGMISTFLFSHQIRQTCSWNNTINNIVGRHHYFAITLLSATVGDEKSFVENIGFKYLLNPVYKFYNMPSTFDFSKSPIYICNEHKMNFKSLNTNFPHVLKMIEKIANHHNSENGIIHTGSYKVANMIYNSVNDNIKSRILIYNNAETKRICIEKIKQNTNYILIGPSLTEGIDLPSDLCRFVIVAKIPYLSMADKYVNKKMKLFKKWYASVAMNNLIQGIGRGNRSKYDYCTCYIIDGCFKRLYSHTKNQVPKYISDRFVIVNKTFIHNLIDNSNYVTTSYGETG